MNPLLGILTRNQADRSGFIAVYPNGTGVNPLYTWNAGWFPPVVPRVKRPDDVKFLAKVLDDLATVAAVDPTRIYVVGMSNGGMMAFRASAELSDRFAAMCSIAGTLVVLLGFALSRVVRARRNPVAVGASQLVGAEGVGLALLVRPGVRCAFRLWAQPVAATAVLANADGAVRGVLSGRAR